MLIKTIYDSLKNIKENPLTNLINAASKGVNLYYDAKEQEKISKKTVAKKLNDLSTKMNKSFATYDTKIKEAEESFYQNHPIYSIPKKINSSIAKKGTSAVINYLKDSYNQSQIVSNAYNKYGMDTTKYNEEELSALTNTLLGAEMTGGLSGVSNKIGQKIAEKIPQKMNALEKLRNISKKAEELSEKKPIKASEKIKNIYLNFQEKFVNKWAKVEELEKNIYKQAGYDLKNVDLKVKSGLQLYGGTPGKIKYDLDNYTKKIGYALKDRKNFDDILKLRRIESRIKADKKTGDWTIEDVNEAKKLLFDELGEKKYTELNNSATAHNIYFDNLLKEVRDTGIISKESYDVIKKSNDFYAPFKVLKKIEEVEEKLVKGQTEYLSLGKQDIVKSIKGIKDSDFAIENVLNTSIEKIANTRRILEKNKAIKSVYNLKNIENGESIIKNLKKGEEIPQDFDKISFFNEGEKIDFIVPKDIADIMKNIDGEQTNLVVNLLRQASRPLKAGATGTNIVFAVSNLIRDTITAKIVSKHGVNVTDQLASIFHLIKKDELYQNWLKSGGGFETLQRSLNNSEKIIKDLEREAKKGGVWKNIKNPIKNIEDFISASETITRLAVFKKALRKGETLEKAALESRDIQDFSRMGQWMKTANVLSVYLNAMVQGTSKMIRAFGERPIKTSLRTMKLVTLPTIGVYVWNNNSEDKKKQFDRVPTWERDMYYIITTGKKDDKGDDLYFKIPKPRGFHILSAIVEDSLSYAKKEDTRSFHDIVNLFTGEYVPGLASLNPALKIPVELKSNYDFFKDREIVPEYLKNNSPENQYDENTSEIAKIVGKLVNYSPMKIDSIINSLGAGTANQISRLIDYAVKDGDEEALEALKKTFNPFKGKGYGGYGSLAYKKEEKEIQSYEEEASNRSFKNREKAKEIYNKIKDFPMEEQKKYLEMLEQKGEIDDDIYKKMKSIRAGEYLEGLDYKVKQIPIKERAKYIWEKLQDFNGDSQKEKEYLKTLEDKDILTSGVMSELLKIRENERGY